MASVRSPQETLGTYFGPGIEGVMRPWADVLNPNNMGGNKHLILQTEKPSQFSHVTKGLNRFALCAPPRFPHTTASFKAPALRTSAEISALGQLFLKRDPNIFHFPS